MMRFLYVICYLLICVFSEVVNAERIVNENFDDGVFGPEAKYCCHTYDSPWPIGNGDCSECTNVIEHVSDVVKSGTYSLKGVYNQYGAAGIKILPSQYGVSDFGQNVYLRFYIKFDEDFRFYSRLKLFRWHTDGNDPYLNANGCGEDGYGHGGSLDGSPYADIGLYSDYSGEGFRYVSVAMEAKGEDPSDWVIKAGDDWWMIEVRLYKESDTPKFDLWVQRPQDIEPTLVYDNETQPNMGTGPFETLDFGWINDIGGGSGGTFWMDEIVIADEYIPPLSDSHVYYVSPDGTADWNECTDINHPCSAVTAMNNAVAGDTVYFRGGTYDVASILGTECEYAFESGRLSPIHSGTSANPIVFKAYPYELPVLNDTLASGEDRCVVLGAFFKNYIVFDGIKVQSDNGTKHAGIAIYGNGEGDRSYGCQIKNCIVNGGSTVHSGGTQWDGIRIEDTQDFLLKNTIVYNLQGNDANTAAIKLYHNNNLIIENCEFYNSYVGLFDKSQALDCIYRYNYIHNCVQGIRCEASYNQIHSQYYDNIVLNSTMRNFAMIQDQQYYNNFEIYNNVFYNEHDVTDVAFCKGSNYRFYNNILYGDATTIERLRHYVGATIAEMDYNLYGANFLLRYNYLGSSYYYNSLSLWQGTNILINGGSPDLHSMVLPPQFANFSGNMNEIRDFMLSSTSPCKGAGRNGKDMGANILLVGPSPIADVNGDKEINISDVQEIVNVVLGSSTNTSADINFDGDVNISDVQSEVNAIGD